MNNIKLLLIINSLKWISPPEQRKCVLRCDQCEPINTMLSESEFPLHTLIYIFKISLIKAVGALVIKLHWADSLLCSGTSSNFTFVKLQKELWAHKLPKSTKLNCTYLNLWLVMSLLTHCLLEKSNLYSYINYWLVQHGPLVVVLV